MRNKSQRGSALLTVLWLCAALSAIGLAVASNVRGETERASTNVDDTKSYFLAKGAIDRAVLHMFWGPDYYTYGVPFMDLSFPEGDVRVEVIPETSKLSLNGIQDKELMALLLALGTGEDRAFQITQAILDWRTMEDPLKPSPLDAFYLGQTPSFLPRHASFIENEELLLVKGITPELYYGTSLDNSRAGLRDCLSVTGTNYALDINTARMESFEAVGIAHEDALTIVKSREQHPIMKYEELAEIQQSLGPAGTRLRLGGQSLYTLRATARLRQADGRLSDLRRTVAAYGKFWRAGNPKGRAPGFEVIRWYDRT